MARPSRLSTFDYKGLHRYFLTFCTHDRIRRFCDADLVSAAVALFLQQAEEKQFALLAYCFMPDHVHLLIEGLTDTADLRSFACAAKQQSGYQDSTIDIARYILANPVRSGLVREPREYEFSGSTVCDREQLDEIWWHR